MTDLAVTPEYLERLAGFQDQASEQAGSAARAAAGIRKALWVTHGLISDDSNTAAARAERARRRAGTAMGVAAAELAEWLRHTDSAYANTDCQAASNLARQMVLG
ncbi:MAG: ESX-1 secretion-associated protein [Mycobacteriaceae bacterium]|nr:ESX-1 secretion-associated protein [Mycobacteriaceae bacterium]